MTWIVAMLGCVSTPPDAATETARTAGYGPDCAESLTVAEVCNCEVTLDVSKIADPSADVRAVVIQGKASAAARSVCEGSLTQSQLLAIWEISAPRTDTGAEPSVLTGSVDLSLFDGSSLFVAVNGGDGTVGAYRFVDIVASSADTSVVLE